MATSGLEEPTSPIGGVSRLPSQMEFVSHGPTGSGPHLMLSALSAALVEAGLPDAPLVVEAPEVDGAAAIRRVAAGGPGVIGSCTPTYLTTPVVHRLAETWRDLTPVAGLVADSYLLVVPKGSVADAAELFAGSSTVAVPKRGGNTDIQAMLLGEATGTKVEVVVEHDPSRLVALVAEGRAQWTTGVHSDFAEDLSTGKLEVLATFDPDAAPDDLASRPAPTLREQGIDVGFPLWRGVIAPGRLPDEVLAAWMEALPVALEQPSWRGYIDRERQRTAYLPTAEFTALLAEEDERYRAWVTGLDT